MKCLSDRSQCPVHAACYVCLLVNTFMYRSSLKVNEVEMLKFPPFIACILFKWHTFLIVLHILSM